MSFLGVSTLEYFDILTEGSNVYFCSGVRDFLESERGVSERLEV